MAVEFALTRLRQFPRDEIDDADPGLRVARQMTERLEVHLTGPRRGSSVMDPVIRPGDGSTKPAPGLRHGDLLLVDPGEDPFD